MKCHAGVEYPSGKPCPKCGAKLGEVCWPGINRDLMDVKKLRDALTELYALVRGECPSLLNEDSGGDAQLDLRIQALVSDTSQDRTSK